MNQLQLQNSTYGAMIKISGQITFENLSLVQDVNGLLNLSLFFYFNKLLAFFGIEFLKITSVELLLYGVFIDGNLTFINSFSISIINLILQHPNYFLKIQFLK